MRLALAALAAAALVSCAAPQDAASPSCDRAEARLNHLERDRRRVVQALRDSLTDYRTDVRRLNEQLQTIDADIAQINAACGAPRGAQ